MTAREKKALWRSIENERRKQGKATLKERQALIKGTRASKKPALAAVRSQCELARIEARSSCAARKARIHADVYDIVTKTRALIDEDKQFAADLRRIEAGNRKRKGPGVSRAVARAESDDEVRQNIDPSLVVLFNQVRKGIKGSARRTRTEEFLEYAETHPDEVFATIDEDAHIAELEARQRRANPSKRRGPWTREEKIALADYIDKHWGLRGRQQIDAMVFGDPREVMAGMGVLVSMVYLTKKEGDTELTEYEHEFSRRTPPLLTWTPSDGKLLVGGGTYRVKEGGITG